MPSTTAVTLPDEFSGSFFIDQYLTEYLDIFDKIVDEMLSSVSFEAGTFPATVNALDGIYKQKSDNFKKLLGAACNYDFFKVLTAGCLTGLYYKIPKTDWNKIILRLNELSKQINLLETNLNQRIIDNYKAVDDKIGAKISDEQITIDGYNTYTTVFFSSVNNLSEVFPGFLEAMVLFRNLSYRLFFDAKDSLSTMQSRRIDISLNNRLLSLNELIKTSRFGQALYLINLRIAELDEFMSCDKRFIIELSDYYTKVSDIFESLLKEKVAELTLDKIRFLLYKILKRVQKSDLTTVDGLMLNIFHHQETVTLSTEMLGKEIVKSPFKSFYNDSNAIYDCNMLHNKHLEILNVSGNTKELHKKFKELKACIRDGNELVNSEKSPKTRSREIATDFLMIKKKLETDPNYSQHFTIVSYQYLVFNISLDLELDEITKQLLVINDLEKFSALFINKYDDFYTKSNFGNSNTQLLFPNIQMYRIFIKCATEYFNKVKILASSTSDTLNTSEIERIENALTSIVDKVAEVTQMFFNHLSVLEDKNYYPVYNDLNLCYTEDIVEFVLYAPRILPGTSQLDGSNRSLSMKSFLFMDSSYILPGNYIFLRHNMEDSIRGINNANSQILSLLEVSLTKSVEKTLETKLKENQFSAIQTLSVYAIVITYILGTITVIPKFDDGLKMIPYFMFVLALVLAFFVICIRFLFIGEQFDTIFFPGKYRKVPRWVVYFFFLLLLALMVFGWILPKFDSMKTDVDKKNKGGINLPNGRILKDTFTLEISKMPQ